MRSGAILGLFLLTAVAVAPMVCAEDTPAKCDIPDSLIATGSTLQKVADAVKGGGPLGILVVGSRSSTISGLESSAYPARLQQALKDRLPQVAVTVSVELLPRQTAQDVAGALAKLMEARKPALVIWQTGTVDAMRSVDPDDFRAAIDQGVSVLQKAGADVILMNLQYSPRTETMIVVQPYLDTLRVVAQEHDIPLFDRFAIMQQWNEQGDFDLFSPVHGGELAKRVHDCLGRGLSRLIMEAAHIGAPQQN